MQAMRGMVKIGLPPASSDQLVIMSASLALANASRNAARFFKAVNLTPFRSDLRFTRMGALVFRQCFLRIGWFSSFEMRMGSHPEFRIAGNWLFLGLPPHILERANR